MNIDILNITTFAETPQLRTVVDYSTSPTGRDDPHRPRRLHHLALDWHRNDRELRAERRALIKDACAGVDMEFAIGLFQDQTYSHDAHSRRVRPTRRRNVARRPDSERRRYRTRRSAYDWERSSAARGPSRRGTVTLHLVFFETLRPCAHLIGGEHGTLGL